MPNLRAFECHVPGLDWSRRTINAATSGKAKRQVFDALKESWDIPFTAIRARCVGPAQPEPPTLAELAQREADEFNARVPVGTRVRYWTGLKEGEPSGIGPTRYEATVLGGHTAVAWITGCRGCVALTHVEVE